MAGCRASVILWMTMPVRLATYSTMAAAATAVEPPRRNSTMLTTTANNEPAMLTKNSEEPFATMASIWRMPIQPFEKTSGNFLRTNGTSDHTAPIDIDAHEATAAAQSPCSNTTISSTSSTMFSNEQTMLMVMLRFTCPQTRR